MHEKNKDEMLNHIIRTQFLKKMNALLKREGVDETLMYGKYEMNEKITNAQKEKEF